LKSESEWDSPFVSVSVNPGAGLSISALSAAVIVTDISNAVSKIAEYIVFFIRPPL
jgi:hypothetical protein